MSTDIRSIITPLVFIRNSIEPGASWGIGFLYRNSILLASPSPDGIYSSATCAGIHVLEALGLFCVEQKQKAHQGVGAYKSYILLMKNVRTQFSASRLTPCWGIMKIFERG